MKNQFSVVSIIFEVTNDKEVVWEYIQPYSAAGPKLTQTDADGVFSSMTFRCLRYGADYPGLAGKSLYSMGTITGEPDWDGNVPSFGGIGFSTGLGGEGSGGGGGGGGGGGY